MDEPMQFEGFYTHYSCPKCMEVMEGEGDLRGQKATCDSCGCAECAVCGYSLHSAVHMHADGGKPGDEPYGHRFVPFDTGMADNGEVRS